MLAAGAGLSSPATAAQDGDVVASKISVQADGANTVLTVHLNRPAKYRVITLPDPYRIVVDLTGVTFELGENASSGKAGIVKEFRYGQFAGDQARIVIDTDGPGAVVATKFERVDGVSLFRLTVGPTTEEAFGKVYRRRKRREAIQREDAAAWDVVTQSQSAPMGDKPVIVIDPGHGGVDSGAIAGSKAQEKDIVLAFSHSLRKALERTGRYDVRMTRRRDVYIPLRKRVTFARKLRASLFLSIHADSVADKAYAGISGTTVYTLSQKGSDAAAREFAARENRSDVFAAVELPEKSDDVANILIELAQRETNVRSEAFARVILGQIRKATSLSKGPHRSAAFLVLKAPDIPSVLIELGYLSNSKDEQRLTSSKWRSAVASALARSVTRYFDAKGTQPPY